MPGARVKGSSIRVDPKTGVGTGLLHSELNSRDNREPRKGETSCTHMHRRDDNTGGSDNQNTGELRGGDNHSIPEGSTTTILEGFDDHNT